MFYLRNLCWSGSRCWWRQGSIICLRQCWLCACWTRPVWWCEVYPGRACFQLLAHPRRSHNLIAPWVFDAPLSTAPTRSDLACLHICRTMRVPLRTLDRIFLDFLLFQSAQLCILRALRPSEFAIQVNWNTWADISSWSMLACRQTTAWSCSCWAGFDIELAGRYRWCLRVVWCWICLTTARTIRNYNISTSTELFLVWVPAESYWWKIVDRECWCFLARQRWISSHCRAVRDPLLWIWLIRDHQLAHGYFANRGECCCCWIGLSESDQRGLEPRAGIGSLRSWFVQIGLIASALWGCRCSFGFLGQQRRQPNHPSDHKLVLNEHRFLRGWPKPMNLSMRVCTQIFFIHFEEPD